MATPLNGSVQKAFEILRLFDNAAPNLTSGEVATRLGMTNATVHRFLLTLEQLGALAREGSQYRLGMLMAELGDRVEHDKVLMSAVQPHIDQLVEMFRESATLTVLDHDRAVIVCSGEAARSLRIGLPVGRIVPLHASAAGKLLLAHQPDEVAGALIGRHPLERLTANTMTGRRQLDLALERIRKTGYAVDDEEVEEGLRSIAVPIFGHGGKVKAALALSAPAGRLGPEREAIYLAELRVRSQRISERFAVESKVLPDKAAPRGSFPHLKRVGDFIHISGTSARRPDDSFEGAQADSRGGVRLDIRAQTRATLEKIADMLRTVGGSLADLVDLEVFLVDIADYAPFNEVYSAFFGEDGPARTTVAVRALPHPHQNIMIRGTAYCPIASA